MSILDHLPKHHSELLLKYDEYIDTWAELVEGLYEGTCGREKVRAELEKGGENASTLSTAIILALLVDGIRAWKAKPRLRVKLVCDVEDSIAEASFKRLLGGEDGQGLDSASVAGLLDVYHNVADTIRQAFPLSNKEQQKDVYARCAALAAYVADRCYTKQDAAYEPLAQELAIAFAEADQVFAKLALSTTVDGNTIFFKRPRFIVMRS